MVITPDRKIVWQWDHLVINETLLFTWVVMALLVLLSAWVRHTITADPSLSHWQNFLEVLVCGMRDQIREVSQRQPERYLPFVGTLFLFIALSNLLEIVPGFEPPTGSLSTTAALAICVFAAVPFYGIRERGFLGYLAGYLKPTVFMLPFNVIGEFSRTLALAVRLYGNIMSGTVIIAILLSFAPFFFPVLMHLLGLVIGLIQAYIFAVLALVYIASAAAVHAQIGAPEAAREGDR